MFFFVEVLEELRIHPIQYLLVGFALCIFYTLLIAISEHLGFAKAYIISAVAVVQLGGALCKTACSRSSVPRSSWA